MQYCPLKKGYWKKRDPENQNGNMWADLNDAGDTGPLNSAGSSLLVESDLLHLTKMNLLCIKTLK